MSSLSYDRANLPVEPVIPNPLAMIWRPYASVGPVFVAIFGVILTRTDGAGTV